MARRSGVPLKVIAAGCHASAFDHPNKIAKRRLEAPIGGRDDLWGALRQNQFLHIHEKSRI